MSYRDRKAAAITYTTEPTLTDQAAARDTDINVIVAQFTIHGQVPGQTGQPMYDDFTQLPSDLRGFIERSRELETAKAKLPDALKKLSIDALLGLTTAQLTDILTPKPADKPAEQKEPK